jgi:hypothetical protein
LASPGTRSNSAAAIHALRNLSDDELVIVSCSSGRWDPDDSDTRRVSLFDEL